tara:strand:+ start:68 stop:277 length:210 start_codon:yes stop_codon:yes gene_type:complete
MHQALFFKDFADVFARLLANGTRPCYKAQPTPVRAGGASRSFLFIIFFLTTSFVGNECERRVPGGGYAW